MYENIGNAQIGDLVKAWDNSKIHHKVGYLKSIEGHSFWVTSFYKGSPGIKYRNIEKIHVKESVYRLKPLKLIARQMLNMGFQPYMNGGWKLEGSGYISHEDLCRARNQEIVNPNDYPEWMIDKCYE